MAQPQQRIKIPRASDEKVVDVFRGICADYGVSQVGVSAVGAVQIGKVNLSEEPSGDFAELLKLRSALIETLNVGIKGFTVTYHRGGQFPPEAKSPIFDEVHLAAGPQVELSSADRLKIAARINTALHGFEPSKHVDTGLSAEQATLVAIHESNLDRLEQLNQELVRQGIEYRETLDEAYATTIAGLEEAHKAREEQLEADFEARDKALESERKRLEVREKEIDDRDNTHARRELRTALPEEVRSRYTEFALTKGTQRLRIPIHIACIVLFSVAVFFTYQYATELFAYVQGESATSVTAILLALKPLGFTFAAVATGVFYIRWLNHWFSQHAEAEFRLKQFQLDIDRASWVVESVLEMKAGEGIMPTALLNSITRNLFEYEGKDDEEDVAPADKLASALLGTASNVRVQAGDAEISFVGKELKRKMKHD